MDHIQPAAPTADEGAAELSVPQTTYAPPSTSDLSEVPTIDGLDVKIAPPESAEESDPTNSTPQLSTQTEENAKRDDATAAAGSEGWEAAKEQLRKDMATSDDFVAATKSGDNGASEISGNRAISIDTPSKSDVGASTATPGSTGRGRGRPPGRPRGSRSRGTVGRGRGGKRKRADRDDDDDDDSDSSEVYTPAATQTKSGRAVQKPVSFVPPPVASPPASNKRKRTYRRNPESAVCKMCLRGTSPATNMIVFCDECNTPYHRYCHHPPIDQAVVDELEKEWFCKSCERERVIPVADSEVADFVGVEGLSEADRRKYFAGLAPGVLATLLVRATSVQPNLPVFDPAFASTAANNNSNPPSHPTSNEHHNPVQQISAAASAQPASIPTTAQPPHKTPASRNGRIESPDHVMEDDVPDEHPARYPRPGQGMMQILPPDHVDTEHLVDEEDKYGVFSHMYQVDPSAANRHMNATSGAAASKR